MSATDRAEVYLAIPRSYAHALGGLWWSSSHDAVERRDGTTLAVLDEIRAVLEGVVARPPVAPFPFVLNLLHLMKSGGSGFEPLNRAFACTRGVVNRGRNAGLLIAELCRGLPGAMDGVTPENLAVALRSLRLGGPYHSDAIPEPPLTRGELELHVAYRLVSLADAALVHWFTHGCGPGAGGSRLADETESLPERMARVIARARRRARLVGAAALVPALDAALTFPPRGRPPHALPLGGYCDVTTRGDPDRLLPGQFALDADEFVRRFAGNELLYFKREEPHEAVRPDRVIVLDQGVRTWGSVRLALAAAALSLLQANPKRSGAVWLFATSAPGPIELQGPNVGGLEERLEASDLTPHPAECLAAALRPDDPLVPRDVVLLTHRRSPSEPAVAAIAAGRGPADRLFALTVDEGGRAELSEWGAGGPVALRAFRVDLEAAESARPEDDRPRLRLPVAMSSVAWAGDVEPVPFPFRPGLVVEPLQFGFAADGDWLVIAGRDGILHGLALDGTPPEVLPRAYRNGVVLKQVDAVLGVTGGVVVCGRMVVPWGPAVSAPGTADVMRVAPEAPVVFSGASDAPPTQQFVAVHYDGAARRVTLHVFSRAEGEPRWALYPELHCVTLRTVDGGGCALDLATLGRYPFPSPPTSTLISRARYAWDRGEKGAGPEDVPITSTLPPDEGGRPNAPFLQRVSDETVYPRRTARTWYAVTPQRDGKPLLAGAELHRAQLAGDVLALVYTKSRERKLLLLRGPDGAVLGETPHPARTGFALSQDGRLIARRDVDRTVTVSATSTPTQSIVSVAQAALHDALRIDLAADPFRLTIVVGGHQHTFRVVDGVLAYKPRWELSTPPTWGVGSIRQLPARYDPGRFPARESARVGNWLAVVDRLGQVVLYTKANVLVASFMIRRERAAAWIPGGVFWGDARLIGSPATPEAGQKIGRAIEAAAGG